MEHAAQTLIVITLLQQCRAEISEIIPGTWFSANSINDGYSPRPLNDIFPTEQNAGYSPTNPIVVLPSHSTHQVEQENTHLSTTSSDYLTPSSLRMPTNSPQTTYDASTPYPQSSFYSTTNSYTFDGNSVTTVHPPPINLPAFNFPGSLPPPITYQTTVITREVPYSQTPSYNVVEPNTLSTVAPFVAPQSSTPSLPYLVISQNPPESISTVNESFTQRPSTAPILFPSVVTNEPDTITPFTYSDGNFSRPTVTFRSTPPTVTTTKPISVKLSSTAPTVKLTDPLSPPPPIIFPGPPISPFAPKLKIRIVAPKGSITNVKINPSTTPKPPPRPPQTRKQKIRKIKNNHETCLDNCKGKREPICGVPLGTIIVEPKMLKGFPSICHMACHNSFKKGPYEKIVDGRCGKVRTRIVRINNAKIHKEELKKSEYSIINNGPQAIVELAGANTYDRKFRKQ